MNRWWMLLAVVAVGCVDQDSDPVRGGGAGGKADDPAADIKLRLEAIDGLNVIEEPTSLPGYRSFRLRYDQPVDHDHPDAARFGQRMRLLHRDDAAPTIVHTTGYYLGGKSLVELGGILEANQLTLEHRYFAPSRPDPADWSLDTIRQSATDQHRIIEQLKAIYSGTWLTTGHSKGGMTAVYHRRFFPDDVDATVAYVAPISFSRTDDRYHDFFSTVGTAECRARLDALEREGLLRRDAMLERLTAAAKENETTFERLAMDASFELTLTGLRWTFWQYDSVNSCGELPVAAELDDDDLFDWIDSIAGLSSGGDGDIEAFMPYYFQAFYELGMPSVPLDHVDDLLKYPDETFIEAYIPDGAPQDYLDQAMVDVQNWVARQSSQILFIYGQNDPWTGGQFDIGASAPPDRLELVAPGANHGARISKLAQKDKDAALAAIAEWMDTPALDAERLGDVAPPVEEALRFRRMH